MKKRGRTHVAKHDRRTRSSRHKAYAARAGQTVSFNAPGPAKSPVRYYLLDGTPVLTHKPGEPPRLYELRGDLRLDGSNGPFSAEGGRLGFLYEGWVILVERRYIRQYGGT